MRSKNRNILTVLVAVFAFGAVGVSSAAAALPEFVHGEGEAFPVSFEGGLSGTEEARIETSQLGTELECGNVKITGSITGAKAATVTDAMRECALFGEKPCETAKAGAGKVTITGSASLDYTKKTGKEVALVLSVGETKITCAEETLTIKGSIILPVTPVNTKTTKYQMTIKGASGKQAVTQYENEKGEIKTASLTAQVGSGDPFWSADLTLGQPLTLTTANALTISA
jgi:hypothetical protein